MSHNIKDLKGLKSQVNHIQGIVKLNLKKFDEKEIADRPIKLTVDENISDVLSMAYQKLKCHFESESFTEAGVKLILDKFFGNVNQELVKVDENNGCNIAEMSEEGKHIYIPSVKNSILDEAIVSLPKNFVFGWLPNDIEDRFRLMPLKAIEQIHNSQRYLVSSSPNNIVINSIGSVEKNLSKLIDSGSKIFFNDKDPSVSDDDYGDNFFEDNQNIACTEKHLDDEFAMNENYEDQIEKLLLIILNGSLALRVDPFKSVERDHSTIIPLKYPVILPGGRFTESYYWDTYWAVRGLLVNNDILIAQKAVKNFFSMVRKFGFVPNGARTYYLERSQPPFLSLMVDVILQAYRREISCDKDKDFTDAANKEYEEFLILSVPYLLDEYFSFWQNPKTHHIVNINNPEKKYNSLHDVIKGIISGEQFLNRYHSHVSLERPESYAADHEVINEIREKNLKLTAKTEAKLLQSIRASCESGWDFSSRWSSLFINPSSREKLIEKGKRSPLEPVVDRANFFASLDTLMVVPVDLNSILFKVECVLLNLLNQYKSLVAVSPPQYPEVLINIEAHRDLIMKIINGGHGTSENSSTSEVQYIIDEKYTSLDYLIHYITFLHDHRAQVMNVYMFNPRTNMWTDYYMRTQSPSAAYSLASFYPYWAGVTDQCVPPHLEKKALETGFAATDVNTGQQWDFPSVWPPLVQIAIEAADMLSWDFETNYKICKTPRSSFVDKSIGLFLLNTFLNFNKAMQADSGNLFAEKYHAVNLGQIGSGGEYANQFGFAWTSGVVIDFFAHFAFTHSIKSNLSQLECDSKQSQMLKNQIGLPFINYLSSIKSTSSTF